MLKKRFVTREGWARIEQRDFYQDYISDESFKGYIALLCLNKVKVPLWTTHANKRTCIVNDGYSWLQQLPDNEHFAVTTMFNEHNEIIQWYIDITTHNGVEDGIPYMEDLFLDLIVLPSGEIIKKDLDEIEEAFNDGIIDQAQYNLAFDTFNRIYEELTEGKFQYLTLSEGHRKMFMEKAI
ncbi:DUF402 domain-containing protein [Solibacillus sp. CAU 1738]|uniref:DUF402 domain-containing protein n=1 Tax=Solibacillus sp. CAU 1738 TaxID=3140363 RepID=UPI003261003F